jgi:hypothetical protein
MTRTIVGCSRSSSELLYGTQSACQSSGLVLLISCYALGHDELRIVHSQEGQHPAHVGLAGCSAGNIMAEKVIGGG